MQVRKRLLQREKESKNKEQQKLFVVQETTQGFPKETFPKELLSLEQDTIIPGSWQGFPSSDINFRDGLPFPALGEEGSPF